MPPPIDDPEHWRARADEARAHAKQMPDAEARRMLVEIAASYDRLAGQTEARLTAKRKQSSDG